MAKSGSEASEWKSGVIESGIAEEQSGRGRLEERRTSVLRNAMASVLQNCFVGFTSLLLLGFTFCLCSVMDFVFANVSELWKF